VALKTRVIRIGNSQGIRIPKALLEESRLCVEVEVNVRDNQIVIQPIRKPRDGWDEAFARMSAAGDDTLLDQLAVGQGAWDEEEWQWLVCS
jgi:antitoxin MazE